MKEIKEKKKRKIKFTPILLGIVVLLAAAQLLVSHYLATWGEKVANFEEKALQLEQANQVLSQQINAVASLAEITKKAEELGFVRSTKIVHLTSQIPVALK
jgi:Tfp pilus assembly protein PilN